jgi:hypothetical protein
MQTMKTQYFQLLSRHDQLLVFLKSKFKLYHLSNVFFRDLHYGIWEYLEHNGFVFNYGESEEIARIGIAMLEKAGILKKLDDRTWLLQYPQFKQRPVQKILIKLPTAA